MEYPNQFVLQLEYAFILLNSGDPELQNLSEKDVYNLSVQDPWTLVTNRPDYLKAYLVWYRIYCELNGVEPSVVVTTSLERDSTWPAAWTRKAVRRSTRGAKPVMRYSPM